VHALLAQDPQNQPTIHQRVVSYKSEANKQAHISRQTIDDARVVDCELILGILGQLYNKLV